MEWVTHLLAQAARAAGMSQSRSLSVGTHPALLLQVARPKVLGSSNRIFVLAAEDSETARWPPQYSKLRASLQSMSLKVDEAFWAARRPQTLVDLGGRESAIGTVLANPDDDRPEEPAPCCGGRRSSSRCSSAGATARPAGQVDHDSGDPAMIRHGRFRLLPQGCNLRQQPTRAHDNWRCRQRH